MLSTGQGLNQEETHIRGLIPISLTSLCLALRSLHNLIIMGIIETIKEKVGLNTIQPEVKKEVRLFTSQNTTQPANMPFLHSWFWTARLGMPRRANITELRQYAKCVWIQMVINAIKKQVMIIDWDVVTSDEEDETDYSEDIEKVKTLLKFPNKNNDTFGDLWARYLHDLLEIDAGVMFKGKNGSGELVELYTYDGSRFLYDIDDHGRTQGYYQYSYKFPKNKPLYFKPDEIIYGKLGHNNEYYPYGWSPLQSITQEIEVMIQATRYNKEFFQNNAVPDVFINIKMQQDELERFKTYWDQQVKGKPHKMVFTNAEDIDVKPLALANKDMEWLAGQEWYHHAIFAAYGLSPQEVGYYDKSSRATGESQERITIKNAIKPYLVHVEDKINREIIPDVIGHDKVMFKWFPKDDAAEKVEHDQMMAKLNANVITINEVRKLEGLEPVEWGDKPMTMVMQDRMVEMGGGFGDDENPKDDKEEKPKNRDDKKDRDDESKKKLTLKEITPDIGKEEAKDYAGFLEKQFHRWERDILRAVEDEITEEVVKSGRYDTTKSFGGFLKEMFNTVNTYGFIDKLRNVIKRNMVEGIEDAEEETGIDIGFKIEFNQQLNANVTRQLDGFNIDGKRWHGLKGVSEDLQKEIEDVVREGIFNRTSVNAIKQNVKLKFEKYTGTGTTEGRAMMIARTESNRFRNAAKLSAYQESGLDGFKVWDARMDNRTTDICKGLNGQVRKLNEMFVDPDTGKEYLVPPAHPNCRSIIRFELDEK